MSQTNPAYELILDYQNTRFELFSQLFEVLENDIPKSTVSELQLAIQAEVEPDKRDEINKKLLEIQQPPDTVEEAPKYKIEQFAQEVDKKRRRGFDGGPGADETPASDEEFTFEYESITESAIADCLGENFIFAQRNEDCFMGVDAEFSSNNSLKYYSGVGSFRVSGHPIDVFFGTVRVQGDY